jgi:DNA-binding transcriptional ArsR family regulator
VADSRGRGKKRRGSKGGEHQVQLIRALNHDLRRRILRQLNVAEEPLSPIKLSKQLKVPLSNVSYHVAVLFRLGAIVRVDRRLVRGAVENFYESTVKDNAPVCALLEGTRELDEASGSDRR